MVSLKVPSVSTRIRAKRESELVTTGLSLHQQLFIPAYPTLHPLCDSGISVRDPIPAVVSPHIDTAQIWGHRWLPQLPPAE